VYIAENTLKPLSPVSIMSSTTNVQNLLSNVFRPTFTYDTTYSNYTSKLELTNIDTVSANAVTVYAVNVGDASGNVYVGILAGNAYSNLVAKRSVSNTFVGTSAGAGASNVSNSVFLGHSAGTGTVSSLNSISIGSFSVAGGNSNIYIGAGTGIATGSNNIFLGTGLNPASTANTLMIGNGGSNMAIVGVLSGTSNRIGINYSSPTAFPSTSSNNALDVNGLTRIGGSTGNGQLGVNIQPTTNTFDVNGTARIQDGSGTSYLFNGGTLSMSNATGTTASISNGNLVMSNTSATGSISNGNLLMSNATGVSQISNATMSIGSGNLLFSNNALRCAGGFYSYSRGSPITIAAGTNTLLINPTVAFQRGLVVLCAQDQTAGASASSIVVFAFNISNFVPILSNNSNAAWNVGGISGLSLSNTDTVSHTFTITGTSLSPPI